MKLENILLDKEYNCKIIDFGFATKLEGKNGDGFNTTYLGTPGFQAPEILNSQEYQGHVVDLFALGVIFFMLYSRSPPF